MSNVSPVSSNVHPLFAQLFAAIASSRTQITYNRVAGIVIKTDGKSRCGTLDEIEQTYGQQTLDDLMSNPGHWFNV